MQKALLVDANQINYMTNDTFNYTEHRALNVVNDVLLHIGTIRLPLRVDIS